MESVLSKPASHSIENDSVTAFHLTTIAIDKINFQENITARPTITITTTTTKNIHISSGHRDDRNIQYSNRLLQLFFFICQQFYFISIIIMPLDECGNEGFVSSLAQQGNPSADTKWAKFITKTDVMT